MTYYEELGISEKATVEEIRVAYRRLARLLHPDKLQDKKLRHIAERQMVRLNGICETLTHPDRRRAYDQSLHAPPAIHPLAAPKALMQAKEAGPARYPLLAELIAWVMGPGRAWIAAAVLAMLIMTWILVDGSLGSVHHAATIEQPAKPKEQAEAAGPETPQAMAPMPTGQLELQVGQLRRSWQEMKLQRDEAMGRASSLEQRLRDGGSQPEAAKAGPVVPSVPPALNPAPLPLADPSQHRSLPLPPGPVQNALTGRWYFAKTEAATHSREMYPPEFIEAVIQEESGILHGRYRARYRVTDRAISPEVVFQFSGPGGEAGAKLAWLGAGGAKGEVRLKLLTKNTLEVAWIASELGQSLGLGSGTAVLIRSREP